MLTITDNEKKFLKKWKKHFDEYSLGIIGNLLTRDLYLRGERVSELFIEECGGNKSFAPDLHNLSAKDYCFEVAWPDNSSAFTPCLSIEIIPSKGIININTFFPGNNLYNYDNFLENKSRMTNLVDVTLKAGKVLGLDKLEILSASDSTQKILNSMGLEHSQSSTKSSINYEISVKNPPLKVLENIKNRLREHPASELKSTGKIDAVNKGIEVKL